MKTNRLRWLMCGGIFAALTVGLGQLRSSGDEKVKPIPVEPNKEAKKDLRPYMFAKLTNSQKVFEGLVTRDFAKIKQGAEALKLTSLGEPSAVAGNNHDDEVFNHFKTEFLRLAFKLEQHADAKNLDGAAYVAQSLNATCIACHQYLRDELPNKAAKGTNSDKAK